MGWIEWIALNSILVLCVDKWNTETNNQLPSRKGYTFHMSFYSYSRASGVHA